MRPESLIFLLTAFVIALPFLITMNQCLDHVADENRCIARWQLWLNLIPVFNIFWVFVTAHRFSRSMEAETRRRSGESGRAYASLGLITAAAFAGFMATVPFGAWNWLMFGVWVLALALYWKEIALQMVWLIRNPAPLDTSE